MKAWKTDLAARMVERAQGDRIVPLREVAEAAGIHHVDRQDAVEIVRAALEQLPGYRAVLLTNSPHDSYAQSVTLIENGVFFKDRSEEGCRMDPKKPRRTNDSTLARLRIAAGLTQGQLAEKCGCSYMTIQRWERGVTNPHLSVVQAVAAALGCRMDDLI